MAIVVMVINVISIWLNSILGSNSFVDCGKPARFTGYITVVINIYNKAVFNLDSNDHFIGHFPVTDMA